MQFSKLNLLVKGKLVRPLIIFVEMGISHINDQLRVPIEQALNQCGAGTRDA